MAVTAPSQSLRLAILGCLLPALLSCGGGGGGGAPPPANRAPAFTSAASVTVAENVSGPVYTATATDPSGNRSAAVTLHWKVARR